MAAQHLPRDLLRPNSGLQQLAQTMKKKLSGIKWFRMQHPELHKYLKQIFNVCFLQEQWNKCLNHIKTSSYSLHKSDKQLSEFIEQFL